MLSMWFFLGAFIYIEKTTVYGKDLYVIGESKPFDVDSFLSSILHSEKFDELAEKIALRTADKFMKNRNFEEYDFIQDRANDDLNNTNPKTVLYHVQMSKEFISPNYLSMQYGRFKKENQESSQIKEQIHEVKSSESTKNHLHNHGKNISRKSIDYTTSIEQKQLMDKSDSSDTENQHKASKSDASARDHEGESRDLENGIRMDEKKSRDDNSVSQNTLERTDVSRIDREELAAETTSASHYKKHHRSKKDNHERNQSKKHHGSKKHNYLRNKSGKDILPRAKKIEYKKENAELIVKTRNVAVEKSDIGGSEQQETEAITTNKLQQVPFRTIEGKYKTSKLAKAEVLLPEEESGANKAEKNLFETAKRPQLIRKEGDNLYVHEDERSDYAEYHEQLSTSMKII